MNILIVPTAKVVNEELKEEAEDVSSVKITLNEKLLIDILYEKYSEKVDKIFFAVYKKNELIEKYILSRGLNIKIIKIDKLLDIGYTVGYALNYVLSNYDNVNNVLVNFGDRIVDEKFNFNKNFVVYSKTADSKRCVTINYSNKRITEIFEKCERKKAGEFDALVGVFNFINPVLFNKTLNKNLNKMEYISNDSFYVSLLEYSKIEYVELINTTKWLDLSHVNKYNEVKGQVNPRYFNTIYIDKKRGLLTKRSDDKNKLINEINWYLKLPHEIEYLVPRILYYSIEKNNPFVTMEYYDYDTLHNLYLFGNLTAQNWRKIFCSLFYAIDEMKNFNILCKNEDIKFTIENMYINKTIVRLNLLKKDSKFDTLFNNCITINNKKYNSLNYYIKNIPKVVYAYKLEKIDKLCIIHGDFCLSNILYSNRQGIVRLIDPRGKFGKYDIYGDSRYDLAKISHSIEGKYDFIIQDLFSLRVEKNNIEYNIFFTKKNIQIEEIFYEEISKYIENYKQIRLIESLLFLSMIPLHKDFPNRQYVMLCRGIELFDSLLKGEIK